MRTAKRKPRTHWWLYLVFALATLGLLIWSSVRLLRETPAREVALDFPGEGLVTARLTTDPFPPLPSGTVEVRLSVRNRQGGMVGIGRSVPYVLRDRGTETLLRSGALTLDPTSGSYRAGVQFPAPGDYWLIFDLESGQQARFPVYVEPAQ